MPILPRLAGATATRVGTWTARLGNPTEQHKRVAIASLVLGILWMYWVGSILALAFGYAARREIRRDPERIEGLGMATAGIVLGWVGIGFLAATIAVGVYLWKTDDSQPKPQETRTTLSMALNLGARGC